MGIARGDFLTSIARIQPLLTDATPYSPLSHPHPPSRLHLTCIRSSILSFRQNEIYFPCQDILERKGGGKLNIKGPISPDLSAKWSLFLSMPFHPMETSSPSSWQIGNAFAEQEEVVNPLQSDYPSIALRTQSTCSIAIPDLLAN